MSIEQRIQELGIDLPPAPGPPLGARVNFRTAQRSGNLLFLSGWGPLRSGKVVYKGKVGRDLTIDEGYQAARLTAMNLLATLKDQLGDLDAVGRWVKVFGMVNSAPGFHEQPAVINGFSDLIVDLYGDERGMHARSAVGMAELPFDIAVEIEAIVEVA